MTEDYAEENLISRTEKFLSHSVLKSINDSIRTLNSCQRLFPMAEDLGIVDRCIESIADKASSTDPSLFGWPVNEKPPIEPRRKRNGTGNGVETTSWLDELAIVSLPMLKRLIDAMRARDLSPEIIENCLIHYGNRHIHGISRSNRKLSSSPSSIPFEDEQRELLETITANLSQNRSRSSTSTKFLFGLLRTAHILKVAGSCREKLEKKIGSELEEASLDDLLIPSYSYLNETLYDVDCVERILNYFLHNNTPEDKIEDESSVDSRTRSDLMAVGKLIDGYLAEIASDTNLDPEKFCNLAVALPENARQFDDGLYRAVDVYLKAHPLILEADRDRVCGLIDCQKLTLEACTHAAQNERLPLRAVIQVLFFEQLQLRQAIAGTLMAAEATPLDRLHARRSNGVVDSDAGAATAVVAVEAGDSGDATWRESVRKNQMLRLDMDSMRSRVHELERECSSMKKAIEKIDRLGTPEREGGSSGGGGWRKLGCKFRTQVCDSQESVVVAARKGRNRNHPKQE